LFYLQRKHHACKYFLTWMFYREGLLAPRPTPKLEDHPFRLSTTAYSIYSQLPSIKEAVPLSATWGRAMPWWQGPTTHGKNKHILLKLFLLNSTEVNITLLHVITSSSPHSTHRQQEFHESVDWESPLQGATTLKDGRTPTNKSIGIRFCYIFDKRASYLP